MRYRREYVFEQTRIQVSLEVMSPLIEVATERINERDIATLQEILPFEGREAGVEAFDNNGKSLGKVGEQWLECAASVQTGRPGRGCRIVLDAPRAVRVGAWLWVRLVGEPTRPDAVRPLQYAIEM